MTMIVVMNKTSKESCSRSSHSKSQRRRKRRSMIQKQQKLKTLSNKVMVRQPIIKDLYFLEPDR